MLAEAAEPLAHRDYDRLRAHMGTAPITSASGKRRLVSMRRACNRKLRWAAYHWGAGQCAARCGQCCVLPRAARARPSTWPSPAQCR
jgi:hypothetical protein